MWVFLLPIVVFGGAAIIVAALVLGRRDLARGGPHPDDVPGRPE